MELYYRNDSWHEPFPNPVPGCNGLNPCPLSVFNELVRDVVAQDWEAECGFRTKWSGTGEVFFLFPILSVSVLLFEHMLRLTPHCNMFYSSFHFGDRCGGFSAQAV